MQKIFFLSTVFLLAATSVNAQEKIRIARVSGVGVGYFYGEHFRNELNVYNIQEMLPESNTFRDALKANRVIYAPGYPNTKGHFEINLFQLTFDPYNPGRKDFCRFFHLQLGLNLLSPIHYSPAEPYSLSREHDAGTHYEYYTNVFNQPDSSLCYRDTIELHEFTYNLQTTFFAVELAAMFHNSYESRFQFGAGIGMGLLRGTATSLDLSHTETRTLRHDYSRADQFGSPQQVLEYIPISKEEDAQTVKPRMTGMRFFFPLEASARVATFGERQLRFYLRGVIGVERFSAVVYNSSHKYSKIGAGLRLTF